MSDKNHAFQADLQSLLKKSCHFNSHEIQALSTMLSCAIGAASFSLKKVTERFPHRFSRNFLAKCLKKYAYVQRRVMHRFIHEMSALFQEANEIVIICDDTLVIKCGKAIAGARWWFDHSTRRRIHGFCLVNVALVVDNQLVFIMPWLLRKRSNTRGTRGSVAKEQDAKTLASIEMIQPFSHGSVDYRFLENA